MHLLTPNAIVHHGVFIWAIQSQAGRTEIDGFCWVHDLHYQTKARAPDNLHNNFGCYNFVYRKNTVAPVLVYRTKWHRDWTKEWFYVEVDSKHHGDFKGMLMSLLWTSFGLKRLKCEFNEATEGCYKTFNIIAEKIGSQNMIQETLAYNIYPTRTRWKLSNEVKSK